MVADSDSDSDDVEVIKGKKVAAPAKKAAKKDSSDSDDSDSSEDKPAPKKAAPAKKAPAKKADSSDDSDNSDDSDDKPAPKKAAKKAASDSDSDSDDSDEKPAPKKKAAKKDSSESEDEDDGPAEKKEEEKPAANEAAGDEDPDNNELFVKSLSFDTTEESLRAHFEQFGTLTKCKLIMSGGRSKGLGFVEFENHADAKKALAESDGAWLDNRQIKCEFSGQKPQMGGPTSGQPGESDTIFCGNLGFHTSEDAIYEFFGQAGSVKNVRIAMNEEGRPKGFCHVEFNSPADA